MLKKTLAFTLFAMLVTGVTNAQDAAPASRKSHDQKMRDCRKQAADINAQGEARRSFVAQCLKHPTRPAR